MTKSQFQGLLKMASEQVTFGIYAIEKGNYAELKCDKCRGMTQLKAMIRLYQGQGFKVHANGR